MTDSASAVIDEVQSSSISLADRVLALNPVTPAGAVESIVVSVTVVALDQFGTSSRTNNAILYSVSEVNPVIVSDSMLLATMAHKIPSLMPVG